MLLRTCVSGLLLAGCAGISETNHAYLGVPTYPPTTPDHIQILRADPKQPNERLGEIILSADGNPSREALETKLKHGAASMGADAVLVVYDKTHVFPIVYGNYWGPGGVTEDTRRNVVGVAIKYK
jgi:hypothetical protein